MIEYEVNLEVDADIAPEFEAWLSGHVDDMLALPGFVSASRWRVLDPRPDPDRCAISVRYALVDQAALERYLRDEAAAMRAEGLARFEGRFEARRRVLLPA
ncbi:MAG: DUF4286 family protein [Xanthomonadales bacterium]|nr:DUF4286 family protein [Xanthomonadales bacterium]